MAKIVTICVIVLYFLKLTSVYCQSDILSKFIHFEDNELQLSHECSEHLKVLKNGIQNNEQWALKVLDASGNAKTGFVWGNNFWLGSMRACDLLNKPPKIYLAPSKTRNGWANLTEIGSQIPLDYRMFYVKHESNIQFDPATFDKSILHIGLCLPMSCHNHDNFQMGQKIFHSTNFGESLQLGNTFLLSTKTLHVRDNFLSEKFVVILLILVMFFVVMNIIGTTYISLKTRSREKILDEELKTGLNINDADVERRLKPNTLEKIFKCFFIMNNFRFIMSNEVSKLSIPAIHGIRTIAMLWIMLGHVYVYGISTMDNIQFIFAYAEKWILQPIFSAAISVDTFFVLSAFLMSYLFFERQKNKATKSYTFAVVRSIANRYIRLTPCFIIVMLIGVALSIVQNDTSQYLMAENIEQNCKKYWWRNVIYIQNFYPLNEMCLSWSWYLATDFQLFVLSTILLTMSLKYKKICVAVASILVIASCIYSGFIGYTHAFGFSLDSQFNSIDVLYTTPFSRVGAYMSGLWTGYYLSKINRQWSLSKISTAIGWFIAVSTTTILVYVQHFREPNLLLGTMFAAFGKTLWAFPICYIILATSMHNSNGFAANLLNSKFFLPLSRMSYVVYLLNPIVIFIVIFGCDVSFHLDFYSLFIYSSGFYVSTYVVAFVFMILFENPILMFIRKFIT